MGVCEALGHFSHIFTLLGKILMHIDINKCSPPMGQFLTGHLKKVQVLHMHIIAMLMHPPKP
ncbi:hypothetical protein A0H81_09584 [Grifola frondosa]|uniref:Uncharacterized protein n=1 Tax=Grifola frondosa TaxID=5627 RepID=A0A1C7LZE3_GRIFR|nr:hypothetical protein A0H81_09584 [Grifola frondosa]